MKRTLLLLGVLAPAAVVIAVSAATSNASTAARSSGCPSFEHVIGFTGVVSLKAGAVANGSSGPSGTETIQLARALQLHIHTVGKRHDGRYYIFGGLHGLRATSGKVMVDDYLQDTGPRDAEGELKYNRSAAGQTFLGGMGIDRDVCEYRLAVDASVSPTYQGSPEIDPAHLVSFGAWSSVIPVPHDLKLHWVGSQSFHTHADCPDLIYHIHDALGCAYVNSGWMPDLIELLECGSTDINRVDPSGACLNNENPDLKTPASLSWNLKPILERG
jgi:hypothetical protein